MFHIQRGDQGPHLWPNIDVSLDGQWGTIALSTGTDLDHLLLLGGQGSDGRDIDFLGDLTNEPFSAFQRGTTAPRVGLLDHDDGILMRIPFSVMTRMSLLARWFLATLFLLTRVRGIRSFDDGSELLVLSLGTGGFNASLSFFRSPMVCLRSTMIWISSSFVYSSYWAASSIPQLYHIFLTFSTPTPE